MRRDLTLALGLVLGCGPAVSSPAGETGNGSTSTATASTGSADITSGPSPGGSSTSDSPQVSSSGGAESSTTGCVDLGPTVEPDPQDPDSRCLYGDLDCGCGYRCTIYLEQAGEGNPWANSGCFPLDPDPVGLGEPCVHQEFAWSGVDNCPAGSMCEDWDGDGHGVCREFCDPNDAAYECSEPDAVPQVGCQKCGCVCEVSCDPLEPDCPEGFACYVGGTIGQCAPDASGKGGGFAEPCEFTNACDGGSMCVSADVVPGCPDEAFGCCTPFCDFAEPSCPEGTVCNLLWDPGEASSPILEGLGLCVDPASVE